MKAYFASLLPLAEDSGQPGDWYLICFKDFAGAVTQARSLAECLAMGQDIAGALPSRAVPCRSPQPMRKCWPSRSRP